MTLPPLTILVTGGAGFIGSALVRSLVGEPAHTVINLDKLTYAGNLESLAGIEEQPNYRFVKADICDRRAVDALFDSHRPDAVMHLAAESHVDRSIDGPAAFVETNVSGTYVLLQAARAYCVARYGSGEAAATQAARPLAEGGFRFLHVSTDEVYGALGPEGSFTEDSPHRPNSPYAATKAAADHLVRAWHKTYGLPVITTNCSNNYGPYQFPEKLIPLCILRGLSGESVPVYGDGQQVRDWLYVDDHVAALWRVLLAGRVGAVYAIGGESERTNLSVAQAICDLLDGLAPREGGRQRREQIAMVADRPGHDRRYAVALGEIETSLGWRPTESFASGLEKTVRWYLDNPNWCRRVQDGSYRGERLGRLARSSR